MFFSVFDEPLQSFKRKIAHNHRDEPDLCQHITDNLGFVGFGWVQYGVLLEEVAWIKKICTDEWCLKVLPLRNSGEKPKLLAQDLRDADTWWSLTKNGVLVEPWIQ